MLARIGFLSLLLASSTAFADPDSDDKKHSLHLDVLNSPVKEAFLKVRIALPPGKDAKNATYRFKEEEKGGSGNHKTKFKINKLERKIVLTKNPQGLQADIPVSELPPGSYQVRLEVELVKSLGEKLQGFFRNDHEDKAELRGKADFSVDASLEVPDPGPDGMTTLAGVDSDQDGVRDDIQRWINENYGSSPRTQAAAKQMAMDYQTKLLAYQDKAKSIQMTYQFFDTMDCLEYVVGGDGKDDKVRRHMEALLLNTRDRLQASYQNSANFNGQFVTGDPARKQKLASKCRFPVNSLAP